MGKKKHKDKASKSKKKKPSAEVVLETESESTEPAEPGDIQYAEHVSAQDVMELVDSLSNDLEQLDKSNRLLQQQVVQNQKTPQRQITLLAAIALILGMGIVTVGYYSARINSRIDENMSIASTRVDRMKAQVESMNTSMGSMSGDLAKLNTSVEKLAANVSTIDQNVNKVAGDINKINTDATGRPYDARYMARPMDPRSAWR